MRRVSVVVRWCAGALAVLMLFGLSGCAEQKPAAPAPKPAEAPKPAAPPPKVITLALQGEPTTLDPQYPDDGNMRAVTENVFEGLLKLNGKTLQADPSLALSYERQGEKTWRFKLRSGVKFHNGQPLTAQDVVFSVNRIVDPAYKSQIAGNFGTIDKAAKVDESTVDIMTKGPDPVLPIRMTLLKIVNEKAIKDAGDKVATQPVGTGPYKVTEWKRGVSITVEKFADYYGTKPPVDKATYRFIQEGATRLAAVMAGEVDLAVNMLPEYAKQLPQVKAVEGIEYYFIRLSQFKGTMKDKRLRLAANYAVNKQVLVDSLFQGYATVAQGQFFKPGYVGYNKNVKAYPYDPEKAKALLKEAGYKNQKVQIVAERGRWLKDGEVAEAVATMLKNVGFNVELKYLSWQEWLKALFDQKLAPDLMFSSHGNEMFDADRTFSSCVHSKGPQSTYANPALDKLIDQARTELDTAKRQATYEQVTQAVHEDPAWIVLLNANDIFGMTVRMQWEPRQDGRIILSEMSIK